MPESNGVYYKNYLQLDKILNAQLPESAKAGIRADDEMLFIIIHQAYELWFKQILFELEIVAGDFNRNNIDDDSPAMQNAVHRLNRISTILKVLVHQIDILETMTPLDFLDFRNLLRPASGFQSFQFKIIEARLGLKFEQRFGQDYYLTHLKQEEIELVKEAEKHPSLIELVNQWLSRMPFLNEAEFWTDYKRIKTNNGFHVFWTDYRFCYEESLDLAEKNNLQRFDQVFMTEYSTSPGRLSAAASRSALFIMLYRDYPIMQLPFQLISCLLDIDEGLATWRYRHINMVHRMIGNRIGTGGSSGKDYLRSAMEKHYIFKEFADLSSFLIERRKLPVLGNRLIQTLCFNGNRRAR